MNKEIENVIENVSENENEKETPTTDFFLYPRNYKSYKWYKPIFILILTGFFYLVLTTFLTAAVGLVETIRGFDPQELFESMKRGYDSFNSYTFAGATLTLGSLAIFIPSLKLATLVVNDRPLSSYTSSRGGWRIKLFAKCFGISLIACALPIAIDTIICGKKTGIIEFSLIGFIVCTILGPLQCIAEEYIFRSLLTQTFASWFRIRICAVIFSAILFMSVHPYNTIGRISIVISGTSMCIMAWIGKGIEASSAFHIANNMTLIYLAGFGINSISSTVSVKDVIVTSITNIVYIAALIFVQKKYHWFDEVKKDDITPFNEKYEKKNTQKI